MMTNNAEKAEMYGIENHELAQEIKKTLKIK